MEYLPIFVDLRARRVVVVGGGRVALRKIELLQSAGARVTVVSPAVVPALRELESAGTLEVLHATFTPDHLRDAALAIAATDDDHINAAVAAAARERGIWVNVVDDLDKSSFIVPSIVDRSPLVVAVSSSGASPMLARRIRARIEALLPAGLGRLAQVARAWRQSLRARVTRAGERRRFWDWFYDSAAARAALDAAAEIATLDFDATLAAFRTARQPERGVVYLVGAGPGDPDLVTLKALEALGRADVILYDRLVSPDILARGRRDAERVYVGKQGFGSQVAQADTSALLARLAREGKTVVRLKGGDPFVFGRGGEEVLELVRQGITVHVIPGITAALGCAAAARIPLTHRATARSVTFATAQLGDGEVAPFPGADSPEQTWVVYMGGRQLGALA